MLTLVRLFSGVFGFHMVLQCDIIDKTFLATNITFIHYISGATVFVIQLVVPFLQCFATDIACDFTFGIVCFMSSFFALMLFFDVRGQGLRILGIKVAMLVVAVKTLSFSFTMFHVHMIVKNPLLRKSFLTYGTCEFFGNVVLCMFEKLFSAEF